MINYLFPILAVIIGYFFVVIFKPEKEKSLKLFLAFSGAFLLSVTVFEMLPELYINQDKKLGLYIMGGILLQIFLEFFSKGAEHGHVHLNLENKAIPWLLFISLGLHAVLEGIPINFHENLVFGIVIHKIPIAIILTSFAFQSGIKKSIVFALLVLFALMTPFGSYIGANLSFFQTYYSEISALVIGIFLHISTTILFESSAGHKFNLAKMLSIVIAIALAYLL